MDREDSEELKHKFKITGKETTKTLEDLAMSSNGDLGFLLIEFINLGENKCCIPISCVGSDKMMLEMLETLSTDKDFKPIWDKFQTHYTIKMNLLQINTISLN